MKHYLQDKTVTWFTLEKIKLKKTVEYYRAEHVGKVISVSSCGGLLFIVDRLGNQHEVETPDITDILM